MSEYKFRQLKTCFPMPRVFACVSVCVCLERDTVIHPFLVVFSKSSVIKKKHVIEKNISSKINCTQFRLICLKYLLRILFFFHAKLSDYKIESDVFLLLCYFLINFEFNFLTVYWISFVQIRVEK